MSPQRWLQWVEQVLSVSSAGMTGLSYLLLVFLFPFTSQGHFNLILPAPPSPGALCLLLSTATLPTPALSLESGRTMPEWICTCISCCLLWWPGVFLLLESLLKFLHFQPSLCRWANPCVLLFFSPLECSKLFWSCPSHGVQVMPASWRDRKDLCRVCLTRSNSQTPWVSTYHYPKVFGFLSPSLQYF